MVQREKPLDTTIEIVTPENIAFEYRLAGPFRRLPAFLVDLFFRFVVWVTLAIALDFLGEWLFGDGVTQGIVLIIAFLMEWLYGGLFETYWNGQTLGKRMMGIRVISIDGQPINGLQAMLRNFLRFADMMPLVPFTAFAGEVSGFAIPTFALALIVPLLNARFQRLGDLVCGTMVVLEEKHWLVESTKFSDPRIAMLADELRSGFTVSRTLAKALATYVDRRRWFSPTRRHEIAEHLAKPLLQKLGMPADTSYDLLLCSLYHLTYLSNDEEYDVMPRDYTASKGNPFSLTQ